MRALVIDDDDSLRALVHDLLIEVGCDRVSFATCNATSLRLARGRSAWPDLIVLDLGSHEVARARQRLAVEFGGAPIVTVTSGDYEDTLQHALAVLRTRRRGRAQRNIDGPKHPLRRP